MENAKIKKFTIAGIVVVVLMYFLTLQMVISIHSFGKEYWLSLFNRDADFDIFIQKYGWPPMYSLLTGLLAIIAGTIALSRFKKKIKEGAQWGIIFLFAIGAGHLIFSILMHPGDLKYEMLELWPLILIAIPTAAAVLPASFGISFLKEKWAWWLGIGWFTYNICGYIVFLILKNIFILSNPQFGYKFAWYISDVISIWPVLVGLVILIWIRKYIFNWEEFFEIPKSDKNNSIFSQ